MLPKARPISPAGNFPSPRKKRRIVLLILTLVLFGFVLILPSILGSKWVYEPLIRRLAQEKFVLTIDSVSLNWLSPLEFRGIAIQQATAPNASASEPSILSIESIRSNRGLLGYLWNGRNLGRIEIEKPRIDIALLENGTNLERLVHSVQGTPSATAPVNKKPLAKLDLHVAIRGLAVYVAPRADQAEMEVVPPFDIAFLYSAISDEPKVIVQPAKILNEVKITQELIGLGLDKAIPFLAKTAWFDGRISLKSQEISIPLERPQESRGQATLTLHEVRSGPSEPLIVGALDAIARLREKEANHEIVFVDGSQILIQVQDARVFHSGLEAGLPRLDSRLQLASEGYVGLADQSLDLRIEIPVPIEQLARRESVKKLGVPKVILPIGGTLEQPEVKWETMRGDSAAVLALIAGQLQGEAPVVSSVVDALSGVTEGQADQAISAAVDLVKQIRERRAKNRESSQSAPDAANAPDAAKNSAPKPESTPRRPLRDALKKALQGNSPDPAK